MEFNDLTDDERTDLQDQIRGLAWAFARRAAGFGGASPYDRALLRLADSQRVAETADLTPDDRRNMYLARLRVLGIMQSELDRAADLEAYCAGAEGANFRELSDAWGISRQGARKRCSSLRAGPDAGDRVRLTYGDGSGCEGTWETRRMVRRCAWMTAPCTPTSPVRSAARSSSEALGTLSGRSCTRSSLRPLRGGHGLEDLEIYSRLALVGAQQRHDDVIGDFPV